ncbi:vWA domain-containing protein [Actinokineospora diospyrosa]|uniref:von Willebrand factor type A domain-containing protein n=1 Tax=Actinokineospora diospyrosa TaxID=103728 RepID=A0ABT1IDD2_9PSEU|nr:substrate-binding domain-containing protein [Actinokineospora diospyrosa]MCP2270640.1 von Willebrand factor type A domain-containing protein [Actinokineospora diospyrosa]
MSHSEDKHASILAVDVESYGDVRRTDRHQKVVRDGLYAALRHALGRARVPWGYHEDRGDGLFLLIPDLPKRELVASLPHELAAALREHNADHGPETQMRLRVAIHAGEVGSDDNGKHGRDLNHAFRLLDSQPLRDALADSPGVLALAVSDWFYEHVVKHQPAANPTIYRSCTVRHKETDTKAWICTPDYPNRRASPKPKVRLPKPKLPTLRLPRPRWQAVVLTALLLVAPTTNLLAGANAPDTRCANPVQVNVLTSTEMAPTLRQLALNFERESNQADENGCRQARLLVVADTYLGAVEALSRGWSGRIDLRDHGPEPHVWLPDSTIDLDHVRTKLAKSPGIGATLEPRPGIARSPIVLATPPGMVDSLHPGDQQWISWPTLAQAAVTKAITRPDVSNSSAGMLTTIAYYQHRLGEPQLTPTVMRTDPVALTVHKAEREIPFARGKDSGSLLCAMRDAPGRLAALVSEKAVFDYNRGRPLGSDCSASSQRPEGLVPLYLELDSPIQDYPFVVVRWTDRPEHRQRSQVIDRFYAYLLSPTATTFLRNNGFRDASGQVGRDEGPAPSLPAELMVSPLTAFDQVRDAAELGSQHPRVLFAVDTAPTMGAPFVQGTRVRAATELVRRLLQHFSDADEVGLMTFGGGVRDVVPLGPGQTSALRSAASPDLPLSRNNSDVYNALEAGTDRLRADPSVDGRDVLVMFTDAATAVPSQIDESALKVKVSAQDKRATRLIVVSLQAGGCRVAHLSDLSKATEGTCIDLTSVEEDTAKLTNLVAMGLWG